MKPTLTGTGFGWIEIEGERVSHDILIRPDGKVTKRKKKLSKELYGTSHKISRAEAEYIYRDGAEGLLIGSGQIGRMELSPEGEAFFREKNCPVIILKTPPALQAWNESEKRLIGLFHVTC